MMRVVANNMLDCEDDDTDDDDDDDDDKYWHECHMYGLLGQCIACFEEFRQFYYY